MNEIEKLEAHIKSVENTLADDWNNLENHVHELLSESKAWLEDHLLHLRSQVEADPAAPTATDAGTAAQSEAASAANEAQPEPPAAA